MITETHAPDQEGIVHGPWVPLTRDELNRFMKYYGRYNDLTRASEEDGQMLSQLDRHDQAASDAVFTGHILGSAAMALIHERQAAIDQIIYK